MNENNGKTDNEKLKVINIGLENFYEALVSQGAEVARVLWRPPVKQSEEIKNLLDQLL